MGEISVEQCGETFIFRISGVLTYDDMLAVAKEYGPRITRHVVWDWSSAVSAQLTAEQIRSWPSVIKGYMINREKGGKSALVASSPLFVGLSRMYETCCGLCNLPFDVKIFHSMDEAMNWLGHEQPNH